MIGIIIKYRLRKRRRAVKVILLHFVMFLLVVPSLPGQAVPDSTSISLGYPVYSQYLQNGLVINPAYAGSRGALSGFLSYRKQWLGTPGSPSIQSLSLHTPMKDEKVSLGFMAQFMQYGFTKATSIYASYAYRIKLKEGTVSFGLKAGFDVSNTNYTDILLTNYGDPVFTSNDKPYTLPNAGLGVYYSNDKYFAGLSIPSFLSYQKTPGGSVEAVHRFKDYDFILSGGGLFTISEMLKFKPSFLIDYSPDKSKGVAQFDINANFILADLIWMGAAYRISEQVLVGIAQVQVNSQMMVGFSYDYPAWGRMNTYSKGSCEFILRYEFGSKVSAANPRYF